MYEQLKLENQLCFPFYAVSRLITRAYQSDLDALGITYPQYLVLMILWEHEQMTVNEIADRLILNTNTVTPLLKRMETIKLLKRVPSVTDQRKVNISLTSAGIELQEKAAQIPLRLVQKMKLDTSEKGIRELNEMRTKLYALMEQLKDIE